MGTGLRKCSFSRPRRRSDNQPSLFEHVQVLHHSESTDGVRGAELPQRLTVMDKESIEQVPASRIRKSSEHFFHTRKQ
jgi:hypothetical protein